jgi:hypothetical protein
MKRHVRENEIPPPAELDQGHPMKNPWTKKNPFMSMWLSAANTVIGQARGQTTAAVRREANKAAQTATTEGVKQVTNFWANALKPPAAPRKPRKPRKRR